MSEKIMLFEDSGKCPQKMTEEKSKTGARGFGKWLEDFRYHTANPSADKQHPPIAALAYRLPVYARELAEDESKLRSLLDALRLLRRAGGPGSRMAEREIMRWLAHIMMDVCRKFTGKTERHFPILDTKNPVADHLRPYLESARGIYQYALECFSFVRDRDSFGGGRRALAFEILSWAAPVFELPEAEILAQQALAKKDSDEAAQAAEFLASYRGYGHKSLGRKEAAALEKLAKEAGSHSTAVSALNALVESGEITEMEALFRIDDWKEKKRTRYSSNRSGERDLWGR